MDEPAAALTGRNYIGGEWRPATSGATYQRVSPIDLEVVGTFASSAADDVEEAVREARGALQSWTELPSAARAAVLARAADDLDARRERVAADMTTEMGKPSRESRAEVARSAAILRYAATHAYRAHGEVFAQSSGRPALTFRRPVGVVGLITPWNFPCAIPAWKLAPALAYGNTVVLKLAYDAPLSGLHIAAAFAAAELPPGVLNVVTGRGATVGAALVRDPGVRAISFTGSVATGSALRDEATRLGKRVQLELGGHNPVIVMADADLDRAAEAAYAGAFWSAGQKCTATRRIFVEADVYDAFRLRLLRRIEQARIGDPRDPETEIGPLVNEEQFNEVVRAIERGAAEGGTLLVGGVPRDRSGYLVAPTVFEDVADDAFLTCEEVFGPVTSLYRFGDLDEALNRANAVGYGLSASIFTTSLATAHRFMSRMQAGILHVNSQTAGADVHLPFGGIKSSGFGPHEQGQTAADFYTDVITAYVDP